MSLKMAKSYSTAGINTGFCDMLKECDCCGGGERLAERTMTDLKLVADIKKRLQKKTTEELEQIWKENKRTRWSDTAFEAVKQILEERGAELQEQDPPTTFSPESPKKIKDLNMPLWLTALCIILPALVIFFLGMRMILKLF